uniref:ApaG domain-containing protein n=1 Tax=Lotharella globosa TaxID=91324 RepID=A0A7S3ZIJ0_9EUKA
MAAVARTLFSTVSRSLRGLRSSPGVIRLIEPVDPQMFGSGLKMRRAPQASLLMPFLPKSLQESPEVQQLLKEAMREAEGGLEGLDEGKVRRIIKLAFQENGNLEDGFTLSKFIAAQTALKKCTSVTVTNGVRVEGTSIPLSPPPNNNSGWGDKKSAFCYRISVENVGDHMVVLIGRHWRIHDNGSNLLHMEIPKGSPGVVGHRPSIEPGERFVYASGCDLPSRSGWIGGSFQMIASVPPSQRGEMEESFDAIVEPIPLIRDASP